ncbi:cryptochrome/photolyase family protein [Frigoribacterium faeni]|uniref:Deoxyribodipyrimidine photo-lyase n=1 Tax=Frigoribacterium faeni TaxID=145483 RepID=A0A7W3PJE0_9MICO|nr:cryptochrome/photolyase family protein [Frigoribacterium faeni]MBA8813958.1 deoxyribodipyrimidine photolyase-related protein [Frigoribacterium faeni]BFF15296.1 cryptochrome/photolyase family protein [Microbacterium flavescens]GEK84257.1 deoxyribodipyrimidine photo-lyase [Frigoribacterium faeni]
MDRTRWIFLDQLGPHFDDGGPMLLVESRSSWRGRTLHRAKLQLILSAIRHRARDLGDRVDFRQVEHYSEAVDGRDDLQVIDPTSYRARRLVRRVGAEILPSRGFVTSEADFAAWADSRTGKRLLMEDFYRGVRERTGVLMEGREPAGGRWNHDHDNRERPPKGAASLGLPPPLWPAEDDIDEEVRHDIARWERDGVVTLVGADAPRRFAATAAEAEAALADFIEVRLPDFGPFEDATLGGDWTMAHSLISAPMNLGLLDPRRVIDAVEAAYVAGDAPVRSVEGFVRQVMGWRDYMWHLYWHLGEDYATSNNALGAREALPDVFASLGRDPSTGEPTDEAGEPVLEANCLAETLDGLHRHGWSHHIQRLMILGNWALQRGVRPDLLNQWFIDMYVDGTPWVMPGNVVGMSQHADRGVVATKPYASGGAYINRMTDHCGGCRFDPKVRLGPDACPVTAGYWAFLDRAAPALADNPRMRQSLSGLAGLSDREAVVAQERERTRW